MQGKKLICSDKLQNSINNLPAIEKTRGRNLIKKLDSYLKPQKYPLYSREKSEKIIITKLFIGNLLYYVKEDKKSATLLVIYTSDRTYG